MTRMRELLAQKRIDIERRRRPVEIPPDDRAIRWSRDHFRLIAEIKRASLSAGNIRSDLQPADLARGYELAGAAAISVLTESHYFNGSLNDLRSVRKEVSIPLLQKDFILDPYQLEEAKVAGADFILLIARFLKKTELAALFRRAKELKLNALVEITSEEDLGLLPDGVEYIGVNSRDLETLQIDTDKFRRLRSRLPDAFLIAESGIGDLRTLLKVMDLGYHAALVGEHFLRCPDPAAEAARFVRRALLPRVKVCGITDRHDVRLAVDAGADALGFIFAESPRQICPEQLGLFRAEIPGDVLCAGVFRNQSRSEVLQRMSEFSLDVAQVYEPMRLDLPTWDARLVSRAEQISGNRENVLWDIKAEGTERQECWNALASGPVFALAGGLNVENAAEAAAICKPRWIDVARGVESEPGRKDEQKLRNFINAVKRT